MTWTCGHSVQAQKSAVCAHVHGISILAYWWVVIRSHPVVLKNLWERAFKIPESTLPRAWSNNGRLLILYTARM